MRLHHPDQQISAHPQENSDARDISNILQLRSEPAWEPSTRYADQPMSLQTRLFGMGGVAVIASLILAGALFTWQTYTAPIEQPTLSVFDVAPPATPLEPPSEIPPGPEQVERITSQSLPDHPHIEMPDIELPSVNAGTVPMTQPRPAPGPPIDQTTMPERQSPPSAAQQSNAKPTWQGAVLAALNMAKRYPRDAQSKRQQGVPYIRFTMNREGRVLSSMLERSSGIRSLDDEAVRLPTRAAPLPKPPDEVPGDTIELVVPVEYFMRP